LRISQDRENTRLGVDRHREDADKLIASRGWTLVGVYEDNDVTGTGRKKRKQFERLLADIERDLVDVVVAQEWPRLERNRSDGVRIIELAQRKGILLTFAKGQDIDCTTTSGRLAADLLSAVARTEIEVKAERQSRAQLQRAEKGRAPRGVRPLGYTVKGDLIPHEAEAVKAIYAAFEAKASLRSIARALSGSTEEKLFAVPHLPKFSRTLMIERNVGRAAEGLPANEVPEDGPWSESTVLGILRNPRYAGYSTYTPKERQADGNRRRTWRAQIIHKDGEPVMGTWEPVVESGQWWSVQEMLDDPARKTNRHGTHRRHLGSGLYTCDVCGRKVQGASRGYRCKAGHLNRTGSHIDKVVVDAVRERLAMPDLADLLPVADEPRVAEITRQIKEHQGRIVRAKREWDAEDITGREYRELRESREALIAQLEAERARLVPSSTTSSLLTVKDPVAAFDDADLATRRGVIELLYEVRLRPQPRGQKVPANARADQIGVVLNPVQE
jgi:DNA invertase Pin-like site-specific DNA recombinase